MANITELKAKFSAEIAGMKRAFQELQKETQKIGTDTKKATDQAGKHYDSLIKSSDKLRKAMKDGADPKVFDGLNKAVQKAQDELAETGEVSEKSMKELRDAVALSQKSFNSLSADSKKEMGEIGRAIDDVNKDLKDLGIDTGLDALSSDIQKSEKDLKDLEKAAGGAESTLEDLGESSLEEVSKDSKKAEKGLENVEDAAEDAAKEVDDLDKEFDGMGKNAKEETSAAEGAIEKLNGTLKGMAGVVAGVFAVDKIKDFFVNVAETTAELGAVRDQYEQVMGDMTATTDKYLGKMSEEWNKHPNELQSTLMQYVAILKGKGIAEEEAHDLARTYLERTVDANAFANESMEDTTARFMGMIKGEYDSVDTAMVNVNATMMNDIAVKEYGKKWDELTVAQQETLKTQEAFRQHTAAGVVGQGAREADSYANNVAMLKQTWDDFLATYGGPVMEAANNGLKFAIGLIEDFDGYIDKAKEGLKPFAEGLKSIRDTIKDGGDATDILKSFGLDPEKFDRVVQYGNLLEKALSQIRENGVPALKAVGGAIKDNLLRVWELVQPAVETAVGFILDTYDKILDFWISDGKQIFEAVQNAFKGVLAVVEFVMPLIKGIITVVWNTITGVINGALNMIMGAVKIFTGLFTGDFSKMWEGVKQLFKGAVEFVWNMISLTFFGRILGGAKLFAASLRGGLSSMWTGIKALFTGGVKAAWEAIKKGWDDIAKATKDVFSNVANFLKNTWNSIKSITSGAINGVKSLISGGWNFVRNTTTTVFNAVRNFLTSTWNTIRNFLSTTVSNIRNAISNAWNTVRDITSRIFNQVWTAIRSAFTNTWNFIKTTASNIGKFVSDTWTGLKNTTSRIFKGIYDDIVKRFGDIVSRAKELPGKIGDGIGKMASKVTSGVTKVINTLASTLGKGVNGVIGGINWVLDKIGVSSDIPKWTVPQYAKGTDGHPGGLAYVGDGKGRLKGPELIQHPDGTTYLSPAKTTLMNLPAGTQVLNAEDTREMIHPHYANGIGDKIKNTASKLWSGAKAAGSKIKDVALNVFDYVKNPGKLLDIAMNAIGVSKPTGDNFIGWMAKGAFNKVKDGALGYIKGMIEKFGGFNGGKFGPPFRLTSRAGMRFHPILRQWLMHHGDDYGAPYGTPVPSQSGGVVTQAGFHKIRGNYVRIKSGAYELLYQHLANMFVHRGQNVSKGQKIGTVGSTGRSTGPHLHFEVWKNGQFVPPVTMGYADGGIVDRAQLAWIAEGGWAESIISHDPAKRSSQRAIWEETGRELDFFDKLPAGAANMPMGDLIIKLQADGHELAEVVEPWLDLMQGNKTTLRGAMSRG